MPFGKKFLLCAVLFFSPFFLAEKAAAVPPVKSSHSNSNTGTNLNTLTSTGTITFTVTYNASGDIKWYKDNALVETDANTANGSLTTAWTAADYGKVKQMKANSTNGDGTSADTVWNVEVQETGTATIAKDVFGQPTIDEKDTLYITDGWTNMPSLYLAGRQEDDAWIEYIKAKTYLIKAPILIDGATLYITADTAAEVRMQGISPVPSYRTQIRVRDNGKLKIDRVRFYGWNTVADTEITVNDDSPIIYSYRDNHLDVTDSNFRHVRFLLDVDQSPGDIIDNNVFFEGNPTHILAYMPGAGGSQGQIISNNSFIYARTDNFWSHRAYDNSGMVLQNNKFIFPYGTTTANENVVLGQGITFTGNEIVYSCWNLVEYTPLTFSKNNNLHDNGGNHNGFNGVDHNYSVGDYCHHFTGFGGFYAQVTDGGGVPPFPYPSNAYIINGAAKNQMGICFQGLYDSYIYNYTADNSNSDIKLGEDHIVIRKSYFNGEGSYITGTDWNFAGGYQPVENIYVIDSVFTGQTGVNYRIDSNPAVDAPGGNPTFWNINTFNRNNDGSTQMPTADIWYANGEMRYYAYLDALVQDSNGNALTGASVTVTPSTDTNYPPVALLLPPPPPDLDAYPATDLPMPDTSTFTSVMTGADGHTPLPNYGWSVNTESTLILLYALQKHAGITSNYAYRISATYNSQTVYKDVTPVASWLREDPCQPSKTVVLTFDKPAGKYALNVNGGTGSGLYSAGNSVNIAAGIAPSGKVFEKWIGDTAGIADVNDPSTSIIVQSADASITAYYKDILYHLTVVDGTGSGDYPAGKTVIVDASSATATQVFYKWTGTGASSVISPAVYSSTLIMPAQNITVTATYRNPISYDCHLTVADGQGTDFYAPSDDVAVSVSSSPFTDMLFDHWEGDTANLLDAGSCNTTLTNIPDKYLIIYPVYRDSGILSNNAYLSGLGVSTGTFSPVFTSGNTSYTLRVATTVTSITVMPTASKGASAVIRVNGTVVNSGSASGPITLNSSGSTTITIIVTAPDTFTTRTYTVTVTKINATTATAYTLTAPSPASGMVDAASGNFTVTPNGKYTGTITITPSGGGLSAPVTLNFSNSSTAKTFTITPTAAGRVTLTPANNGSLTDPAAVTYTAYVPGTLRNSSWNYPNPVNFTKTDKTTIAYTVEEECNVYICLYTLSGDLMKVLVNNKTQAPGKYYIDWYGDNDGGAKVASGVYLYIAKIGNDVIRKKIVLLR